MHINNYRIKNNNNKIIYVIKNNILVKSYHDAQYKMYNV